MCKEKFKKRIAHTPSTKSVPVIIKALVEDKSTTPCVTTKSLHDVIRSSLKNYYKNSNTSF